MIAGLLAFAGGCTGFGPQAIRTQQVDYAQALADAAKQQTLLNIVKLRYGDAPSFLSVSQVVAGYSIQGNISVGTDVFRQSGWSLSDDIELGAGSTFSNNPTVTYSPVTGADFARLFLAPLPPADLFGLLLAGARPELVLGLGLRSIGRYANMQDGSWAGAGEPGFEEVFRLLIYLARHRLIQLKLEGEGAARRSRLILLDASGTPFASEMQQLRWRLGLPAELSSFELVYTLGDPAPGQIPIRTRSLVEVMGQLAAIMEVPQADIATGRAEPTPLQALEFAALPRLQIRHGLLEPQRGFVSVYHEGHWFWIDERDLASKRVFSFVLLLQSLAQSSRPGQPPILTIPTG